MTSTCKAEHIAVGSEILLGQINNSHAQTISLEFAKHGLFLFYHTSVGDNMARIQDALRLASSRSNLVIVTGGLGPTVDDLTKEALALFLNRPLEMSAAALAELETWFANRKRKMPEENRKQALMIQGAVKLNNPNGTAPGQYVESHGVHYFLLPGPPLEMLPMLRNEVIPRLHAVFANRSVLVSRVLHFCGIGESDVDEQVKSLTQGENPTVAPLAGEGEMLLRITASDVDSEHAWARIRPVEEWLRNKFPAYIYGVDDESLPSVVGDALRERNLTLSTAESCTGGLISSMLTDIPGASDYFAGGATTYQNLAKMRVLNVSESTLMEHGAVSQETAREMANGVRNLFHTSYGISVTGIAGPTGGTADKPVGLVYGAISDGRATDVYELYLRGSRQQIRLRTTKAMLWRLWRKIVADEN